MLGDAARELHYKERTYARLFQSVAPLAGERIAALLAWVAANKVDQKECDAVELVAWLSAQKDVRDCAAVFTFSETSQWFALLAEIAPTAEPSTATRIVA